MTLADGSKVTVSGAQIPGGQIQVYFFAASKSVVAINPGGYIYPADLRINADHNLLYVKASGLAGGIQQQTWIFEYDLRSQRLLTKLQVADKRLPAECVEPAVQSRVGVFH